MAAMNAEQLPDALQTGHTAGVDDADVAHHFCAHRT
jgi:hypothetical protein